MADVKDQNDIEHELSRWAHILARPAPLRLVGKLLSIHAVGQPHGDGGRLPEVLNIRLVTRDQAATGQR